MANLELIGMDELLAEIRQKLKSGVDRLENKGLRAGGEVIAESMRQKVSVSTKKQDHMRDDIKVSGVRRKDGIKFVAIGPGKKTGWRAHFNEFGTRKMKAKPFAYPAFHEKKAEAMEVMAETFREGLRE